MGKMMNFGRRTTPLTTDPITGARIADPSVYGKTVGTGEDQVTVNSWPGVRDAWRKLPKDEREDYTKYPNTQVANYMLGITDRLDDVNIEEPTYLTKADKSRLGSGFTYSLKKDSPQYLSRLREFAAPEHRGHNFKEADGSSMSNVPEHLRFTKNPLTMNPLTSADHMYDFYTNQKSYSQDYFSSAPREIINIRANSGKNLSKTKPGPEKDEVKTTAINKTANVVNNEPEVTAPVKKEALSKKDLEIKKLPIRGVGQIETEKVRIKRIADPNEPVYYGAGMLEDTSPKALKVQRETSYNREKRGDEIAKSSETGERIQFAPGGAINKKDLKLQAKYNKQYDKFQAEKDKDPMNNKTLQLFYNKRFGQ